MIVVDTNVIAYFWLPGDYTVKANNLYKKDPNWISPFLWRSEFRNILALYLRKGLLSKIDAVDILQNAEQMMKGNEYSVESLEIVDKIEQCGLSAYDLEFVVLAESLELKLVTLDSAIIKEFPEVAVSLSEI
ncbi:MAG: type II toxin-antitoxin system VapC family toxin [Ignavibacteria bacterium]|jgi:predicted nucleic acid-binding protein